MERPVGFGPDQLPRIGGWIFTAAGFVMVAGGLALAFEEPGGLALSAFGLVFVGAGWLMRRLFTAPEGQRAVMVGTQTVGIANADGTGGARSQGAVVYVDEDADDEQVRRAEARWYRERFAARSDWVEGRVRCDDQRLGAAPFVAPALWAALTAGLSLAAAYLDDFIVLFAVVAGGVTAFMIGLAVRTAFHRRRFGGSYLALKTCPVIRGDRLEATVQTGIDARQALPEGFRAQLRCVHVRVERRNRASDSRPDVHHRDVLWESDRVRAERAAWDGLHHGAWVSIAVPGAPPSTSLSSDTEGVRWELDVSAKLSGLDYGVTFRVPVLSEDEAKAIREDP